MTVGIVERSAGAPCTGPAYNPPGRSSSPRSCVIISDIVVLSAKQEMPHTFAQMAGRLPVTTFGDLRAPRALWRSGNARRLTLKSPEKKDHKDSLWPKPMRGVKDPDPQKRRRNLGYFYGILACAQ